MDETRQLCSLDRILTKRRRAIKCAQPLSHSLSKLMDRRIKPRHKRFGPVIELWQQLLPTELSEHSRVDGILGGQLKVLVDSPSHMHELRLCSSQLLEQLQQYCPQARIKDIKFVIDQDSK
jgi:predicted nucleic acid-binding Zn ribbon protein